MTENDNIVPEPPTVAPPVVMHLPPPPPQYIPQMNKSGRNTVIVMAILFLIWSLTSLAGLSKLSQIGTQYYYLYLIHTVTLIVAYTAVAVGLFQFRAVARVGAIYLLIFRALTGIPLSYLTLNRLLPTLHMPDDGKKIVLVIMVIGTVFLLTIFGIMIYYLTRPAVKEACNK